MHCRSPPGLLHCAYVLTLFFIFPYAPWWLLICLGLIYSISVSWNMNGISHNHIHNPYFTSRILNRLYSIMLSVTLGISQTFYKYVHHRHHMGNSDRPDENGNCQDWISIYRHGHDGEAENPWSYIFLSYLREDPKAIYTEIKRKNPVDAKWGITEIVILGATIAHRSDFELEILGLFSPLLLLWTLLQLSERIFSSLRRESRQTDRLGGQLLRQMVQLDLVQ